MNIFLRAPEQISIIRKRLTGIILRYGKERVAMRCGTSDKTRNAATAQKNPAFGGATRLFRCVAMLARCPTSRCASRLPEKADLRPSNVPVWSKLALVTLILFPALVAGAAAQEAKRSITEIGGGLYRFQNNFHNSVFLVTSDGVIATDPINAAAATWLKDEIAKRFDKKIKYAIYSHDHADHISGGEVWADDAIVIAHENAKKAIIGENRPTAVPDLTFHRKMSVELGGKTVELKYLGRSHSDNMIVMHFPEQRAVFTVDFTAVKRLPYRNFSDAHLPDWIRAIKRLGHMDFDIMLTGHGPNGTKQDAIDHGRYIEDLYNAVQQGKSLAELQASITLDAYKAWGQYDNWRTLNIEGMYNNIALHRRGN
jgi:glyoxylase-like metal-dependent hydrolase (beta-lactamase superfamily II)